jgi:hypothetical protein
VLVVNILFSLKHGDYSWDGNSQHGIISRSFIQNGSVLIDNVISPFQGYPSTVELKGSLVALVFGSYLFSTFAQMPFVLLFILMSLSITYAYLSENARKIVVPGILGSGTLIFAGGFNYSDIAQGLYWLLLLYSIMLFRDKKNVFPDIFFSVAIAGIVATKFAGLYALIIFLILFPALPAFLRKMNVLEDIIEFNKRLLVRFYLSSSVGLLFGSVWLVRNFISFNNILFPGPSPFAFMTDGPLSSVYLNGMLNGSRSLEIQGSPNEFVVWWNFVGSLFVGVNILVKDFVYLLRGRMSEINTMLPEVVGHDARLAGLGLSLQVLFLTLIIIKFTNIRKVLVSRKVSFSSIAILICVLGIAFTPGNSAMRYFVGTVTGLILLVACNDGIFDRISKSVSTGLIVFSIFSLALNLGVASSKIYNLRNVIDQTNSNSIVPSSWFGWEVPPSKNLDCYNTAVVGFASSFPTILWGNKLCSKVTRFSDGKEFMMSKDKMKFNRIALTIPNPESKDSPQIPSICLKFNPSGGVSNVVSGTNESRLAFYFTGSDGYKTFELDCISKVSRAQW